jgi:GNAT superfamily N-acetyltransferase
MNERNADLRPAGDTALAGVTIRAAVPADAGELARLRLAMHRELGDLPDATDPAARAAHEEAIRRYFEEALPTGDFRAWVAEAPEGPGAPEGSAARGTSRTPRPTEASRLLVACSGLVLYRRPPSRSNLSGWEGYLMNMYTEPPWRRRGIAAALVRECIQHTQAQTPARRIRLHATTAGRPVYERAGFVLANVSMPEMVLTW